MTENDDKLNVPSVYEPVILDKTDSARAHAERLAEQGADEGTLVWALAQQEGLGRKGSYWMSGSRNLHCAIIFRPEEPFAACCQLSLVSTVAAAMAIAQQAEPLVELRFRWPNDVLLNRGKVAGITLSGVLKDESTVDWMVVSLNVNVYEHPSSKGFAGASMRGEGFEQPDSRKLLEAYCREFLSWLDRWANDGFAPVRKAWLIRGGDKDTELTVNIGGKTIQGTFMSMGNVGSLKLKKSDGKVRTLSLVDFVRPDFKVAGS